jgi:anaerobic ribonucleoside-triphosphate reductase activating protein
MNYIGLNKYDTANGPGIRVSLFVSGCTLHCKGCFNQESWDFNGGKEFTSETLNDIIKTLKEPHISGFSILGGDPLEPEHFNDVYNIVKTVKTEVPDKTIWLWTGRLYEKVKENRILDYVDVLIDGPFKIDLKGNLKYRGSSNQRIIFLKG